MKTISRSNRSVFGAALVLGGLAALYFYRRNGGQITTLLTGATEKFNQIRDSLGSTSVASGMDQSVDSNFAGREDLSTNESMDAIPAH